MKMKTETRRGFIKKSAVVSAGLSVGAPAYIKGFMQNKPNEVINVAVAGIHDRGGLYGGTGHTANFTKIKNSRVVAICDADENCFPKAITDIETLGGEKPKAVVEFRELLDNRDVDIISIAAPDYWHALMTIWACQAGKDVYVEKPLSYNIVEGRKMVQAASKYNRIVQIGTQYRANRFSQKSVQLLLDGVIGDIYMGRGTIYRHRPSIGRIADSPVPQGVHWDLYRGPAPMIPFNKNHFHYNWHWYWDTATGEFGNNGVHAMDRIRMAMKINSHPTKISCCGGFYGWDSDQKVPNLQVATFEYNNGKILELEVRSLYTPEEGGILFFGNQGYAVLGIDSFQTFMGPKKEPGLNLTAKDLEPDPVRDGYGEAQIDYHFVNFLDCVKSRKQEDLLADVNEGHLSTAMMHLGNIAYRTGRKLTFNGETERFVDDEEANAYLTRQEYRKPYLLPEEV
jgi:predicted dehydrogenase